MSLAILLLPDILTELRHDLAVDGAGQALARSRDRRQCAEIHAKTLHIEQPKMKPAVLRRALRPLLREARPRDRAASVADRRTRSGR